MKDQELINAKIWSIEVGVQPKKLWVVHRATLELLAIEQHLLPDVKCFDFQWGS